MAINTPLPHQPDGDVFKLLTDSLDKLSGSMAKLGSGVDNIVRAISSLLAMGSLFATKAVTTPDPVQRLQNALKKHLEQAVMDQKLTNMGLGAPTPPPGAAAAGGAAAGEVASLGAAAAAAAIPVAALTAAIAGLVKIGQPATYQRFALSLRDMAGTFGKILAPVLDGVTEGVRALADAFVPLIGVFKGLTDAMKIVPNLLSGIMAIISKGSSWLKEKTGVSLGEVASTALRKFIEGILSTKLGMTGARQAMEFGGQMMAHASTGMGGREVTFGTGLDLQRKMIQAAFRVGANPEQVAEGQRKEMIIELRRINAGQPTGFDRDRRRHR